MKFFTNSVTAGVANSADHIIPVHKSHLFQLPDVEINDDDSVSQYPTKIQLPIDDDMIRLMQPYNSKKAWVRARKQHLEHNSVRNNFIRYIDTNNFDQFLTHPSLSKKQANLLQTFKNTVDKFFLSYVDIFNQYATTYSSTSHHYHYLEYMHYELYQMLSYLIPVNFEPELNEHWPKLKRRLNLKRPVNLLKNHTEFMQKLLQWFKALYNRIVPNLYAFANTLDLHVGRYVDDAIYYIFERYVQYNSTTMFVQRNMKSSQIRTEDLFNADFEPWERYRRFHSFIKGKFISIPTCLANPDPAYFKEVDKMCKEGLHLRDCGCSFVPVPPYLVIEPQAITCSTISFQPTQNIVKEKKNKTPNAIRNARKRRNKAAAKRLAHERSFNESKDLPLIEAQMDDDDRDIVGNIRALRPDQYDRIARANAIPEAYSRIVNTTSPFPKSVSSITDFSEKVNSIDRVHSARLEAAGTSKEILETVIIDREGFVAQVLAQVVPEIEQTELTEQAETLSMFAKIIAFFKKVRDYPANLLAQVQEMFGGIRNFFNNIYTYIERAVLANAAMNLLKDKNFKTIIKVLVLLVVYVIGWKYDMMHVAFTVAAALSTFMFDSMAPVIANVLLRFTVAPEIIEPQSDLLIPRQITSAVAVLCSLIFGKFTAWTDPKIYDDFITRIDRQSRAMAAMSSISERILWVFKKIMSWIGLEHYGFSEDLTRALPPDVEAYINEVKFFYDKEVLERFVEDIALCERISNLFAVIPILQSKYAHVPIIRRQIDAHVGFIHRAFSNANLVNPTLQRPRTEPVTIFLRGAAGVGKTKLVFKLAAIACAEANKINANMSDAEIDDAIATNVYSRQIANEYWDGYHSQEVTVVDDFGQKVDSQSNPNEEYLEFIMAANSFSLPLHMADISQKSKTYFKSSMYIATTNLRTINPPSLYHAPAFHRRMNLAFEVRLKPEFADPITGRIRPDIASGDLRDDIHTFHAWNASTGVVIAEAISFEQLQNMIIQTLRANKNKGKSEMAGCVRYARTLFANRIEAQAEESEFETSSQMSATSSDQQIEHLAQRTQQAMMESLHERLDQGEVITQQDLSFVQSLLRSRSPIVVERPSISLFDDTPTQIEQPLLEVSRPKNIDAIIASTNKLIVNEFIRVRCNVTKCYKFYLGYINNAAENFFSYLTKAIGLMCDGITAVKRATSWTIEIIPTYFDQTKTWLKEIALDFKEIICSGWAKLLYCSIPIILALIPSARKATIAAAKKVIDYPVQRIRDFFSHDATQSVINKPAELVNRFIESPPGPQYFGPIPFIMNHFRSRRHKVPEEIIQELEMIEEIAPESGRGRSGQKAPRRKPVRAILRNQNHVQAEAWSNDNSGQIADKVAQNLRTLYMGNFKCHIFMIYGHKFVINGHIAAQLEYIANHSDTSIIVCYPGAKEGTEINFSDLEFAKSKHEGDIDLLIGTLPSRYFHQCSDIRKHLVRREEINLLKGQTAALIVPSDRYIQQKHGIITDRHDVLINSSTATHYRTDAIHIKTSTQKGDCGGCYIVDSNLPRRIFGIHGAGLVSGGVAYAIPLYQEMFFDIEPQADECELDTLPLQQGGGNVLFKGKLPAVFAPARSQIVQTKVHNHIYPSEVAPAALAAPLKADGPMLKALEKQFGPVKKVDEKRLIIARENYEQMLSKTTPADLGVLSFEIATRGIEGSDYYRGINRSRSAGYPWAMQTQKKGKTQWFGTDEWLYNESTADLEKTINQQICHMENNIEQTYIFMDTLKDETRSLEKVAAKKTRVFAAAPMDFIIVFRMYYLDFLVYMMRNRIFNESAVGIKAQSDEWTMLRNHLLKFGERTVAGDFSNYDGSLNPAILWSVFDVISGFYQRSGATPAEQNVRKCLWSAIVNSNHIVGDLWYQLNHSQPSGNPSTAILNSMYNSIACRYVFYTIYSWKTDFNDHVSMIAYGDDNVLNISPLAPEFNQENMAKGFETIGMVYTDEAKTGELSDKTLDRVAFLKRTFAYDDKNYFCFAPLALPSILEAFNWIKKSDSEPEIIKQIAENALVELSMHPKHVFDLYSQKIHTALRRAYDLNIIPKSQSSYRMSIIEGKIFSQFPTLEWA